GLGDVRALGGGCGVWCDIVKIGEENDGLGVEFTSFCVGVVGDGMDIRFWVDRWVDNQRLCGRFSRLYHLERRKESSVMERGGGDRWKWAIGEDGEFTVKELSRLIEEKILRALRGRLPVRVELDRRGIDVDSVLCPSCSNIMETCTHCLITCDLAMGVWEKIFNWWKVGVVNAFSLDEFFSSNGNVNVSIYFSPVWQSVIWTTGYFI
nr:reverse transcriptase domain, reverse transcriptase zinc-binding domain protein [Tanacetum cinerariifolium]